MRRTRGWPAAYSMGCGINRMHRLYHRQKSTHPSVASQTASARRCFVPGLQVMSWVPNLIHDPSFTFQTSMMSIEAKLGGKVIATSSIISQHKEDCSVNQQLYDSRKTICFDMAFVLRRMVYAYQSGVQQDGEGELRAGPRL